MAKNTIIMKKFFLLTTVAVCLALPSFAAKKKAVVASTIQLPEQEVLYNEGNALLKESKYAEAIIKFTAAISIDTTFAKAYYNRAVAYFNEDKISKAMSDVDTSIRLQKDSVGSDNMLLKGKLFYSIGNIPAAKKAIEQALEINPHSMNAMLDKAAIYEETKEYDIAIDLYNQINYKTGGNSASYNELGLCYQKIDNVKSAYESFKKAFNLDTTNIIAKYNFALSSWESEKDTANSISLIESLIKYDIENPTYYCAKGYVLSQAGRYDEAITNFNIAIKLDSNNAEAYLGKSIVAFNLGETQEAMHLCTQAINANTNYGDAYVNRGIIKESTGDFMGACDDFKKGAELGAKHGKEYYSKQCE